MAGEKGNDVSITWKSCWFIHDFSLRRGRQDIRIRIITRKGKCLQLNCCTRMIPHNYIPKKLQTMAALGAPPPERHASVLDISQLLYLLPCSPEHSSSSPAYRFRLHYFSISTLLFLYHFNSSCRSSLPELSNSSPKLPIILLVLWLQIAKAISSYFPHKLYDF